MDNNNSNIFQVFVKTVDGRTINLPFSSDELRDIYFVKQKLFEREGIPTIEQRLSNYQRDFRDDERIEDIFDDDDNNNNNRAFICMSLSLRLNGGKGGFGSQLRGQQTQVGQKKTTNFDACRDLSGRRLREIHTQQRLTEWKANEDEREYEKIAEKYLHEQRVQEENEKEMLEEMNYFKEKEGVRDSMQTALQVGLEESKKEKRKLESDQNSKKSMPPKKRMLGFFEDIEDDDNFIPKEKQSEQPNKNGNNLPSTTTTTTTTTTTSTSQEEQPSTTTTTSTSSTLTEIPKIPTEKKATQTVSFDEKLKSKIIPQNSKSFTSEPKESKNEENSTLDLSTFSSPSDLEKLGLDALKLELQKRGMKCGGTLQERANRLWTVKLGNVDKKDVIEKGKKNNNNNNNNNKIPTSLPNVQIKA